MDDTRRHGPRANRWPGPGHALASGTPGKGRIQRLPRTEQRATAPGGSTPCCSETKTFTGCSSPPQPRRPVGNTVAAVNEKTRAPASRAERYPFLQQRLEELKSEDRYRFLRRVESEQAARIVLDGTTVRLFCSNNYLGLANHPRVKEAAAEAARSCGCGSGASRLISGNMRLHEDLEERIARFLGSEAVLLFNNGYTANVGILSSLMGEGDTVFSDALNHASLIDGCRLSRAEVRVYRHGDAGSLEEMLQQTRGPGKRLIITDSLFSMDGDLAPLPDLAALARTYGCLLMVDEAHAVGVLGPTGRGAAEAFGVEQAVDLSVGTLGKALGSFGAFVACSGVVRDFLINHARSLIFSTSLPPPVLAAAAAALEIVQAEPGRRDSLRENARRFGAGLREMGFPVPDPLTHVQRLLTGDARRAMDLSERLLRQGIFAQGIRPPTVPAGTARIRFSLMATHTHEDIDAALEALGRCCPRSMSSQ
jgi:glycine C-acetyltransferase